MHYHLHISISPKRVLYDYSNPVVEEDVIKKRTGDYYLLYFGAINSKEAHQKLCNSRPKSVATTVQEKQKHVKMFQKHVKMFQKCMKQRDQ